MEIKLFSFSIWNMSIILMFIFQSNICYGQSPQTISNINIQFVNRGTFTDFILTSTLGGTISNQWMGVGLNSADTPMVFSFF
jgi:hypothetical protein